MIDFKYMLQKVYQITRACMSVLREKEEIHAILKKPTVNNYTLYGSATKIDQF